MFSPVENDYISRINRFCKLTQFTYYKLAGFKSCSSEQKMGREREGERENEEERARETQFHINS